MRLLQLPFSALIALFLAACAMPSSVPPTSIHQPMSVRPTPVTAAPTQGGIYNVATARPLFEDRRARYVGDTITVIIAEKTTASKLSENKSSRSQSFDLPSPTVTGLPMSSKISGIGLGINSANAFDGKGGNTSANDFSGLVTVTVVDVYPNGNLLISGEKQIGLKEGDEFVRFSGVVNPTFISGNNTILSTQIADARMEYKANGALNDATNMGWLSRFFQNILPF